MSVNNDRNKTRQFFVAILFIMEALVLNVQAKSYPDISDVFEPTTNYADFAAFDPPVFTPEGSTPEVDIPIIVEWTRQNKPGDTMVLTGEHLSVCTNDAVGSDSQFFFYGEGPESNTTDGSIQRLFDRQCAITLPDENKLRINDVYMLWPENKNGPGEPVLINKTEAWWIGNDQASVGETFSIYGRNLSLGGKDSFLWIQEHGWLTNSVGNPYCAEYTVPSKLTNGTYRVYAHNGHGLKYGWSDSLTLTIETADSWMKNYDVTDYGAVPDDGQDDLAAINACIAATPCGSTVYFPEGTFNVSSRIYFSGKRIKGAGMDRTVITSAAGMELQSSMSAMILSPHPSGVWIEDIEIATGSYVGPNASCLNAAQLTVGEFNRVRFSHLGLPDPKVIYQSSLLTCEGGEHIKFIDCEFIAFRPLNMNDTSDVLFNNCRFYGTYDANVMMYIGGSEGVALKNCLMRPYDDSNPTNSYGWGKGRWVSGSQPKYLYVGNCRNLNACPRAPAPFYRGSLTAIDEDFLINDADANPDQWSYTRKLYFETLTRELLAPDGGVFSIVASTGGQVIRGYRIESYDQKQGEVVINLLGWELPLFPVNIDFDCIMADNVDQNSGEQFMFEGCFTTFRGKVSSSTDIKTTFGKSTAKGAKGRFAIIIDGKGQGQVRKVASVYDQSIILEKSWKVAPDETSTISIGKFGYNSVIYSNYLDGVARVADPSVYTATTAFSLYGGFHGAVVVSNVIQEVNSGILQWSLAESTDTTQPNKAIWTPNYFGYYADNRIDTVQTGIGSVIKVFQNDDSPYADTVILGSVWRNNSLLNTTVASVSITRSNEEVQSGMQVIQDTVSSGVTDSQVDSGHENIIFVDNDFREGTLLLGSGSTTFRGTSFGAYKSDGISPTGVLEFPQRVVEVLHGSTNGTFKLWNSGIEKMEWEAKVSEDWLSLDKTNGWVDKGGEFNLDFYITPPNDSGSDAKIIVTAGGQTKYVTVVYANVTVANSNVMEYPVFSVPDSDAKPLRVILTDQTDLDSAPQIKYLPEEAAIIQISTNYYNLIVGHVYYGKFQFNDGTNWVDVPIDSGKSGITFRHDSF